MNRQNGDERYLTVGERFTYQVLIIIVIGLAIYAITVVLKASHELVNTQAAPARLEN